MTPPHLSPDQPGAGLATRLRAAADLLDQDPASVPAEVQRQAVLELAALAGVVDAELARWLSVFDANTVWAGDGARSAGGWIAAHSELSRGHAAGRVRTARILRSCPAVTAAYSRGELGTEKVRALLDARDVYPDLFAEHEAGIVGEVVPLTVAHARVVIARWAALAQATLDAEARQRGEDPSRHDDEPPTDPALLNALRIAETLDGRVAGDFDLDSLSGTQLRDAITARIDAMFHQGTYTADDGLTHQNRQAAALLELALRGAQADQTKHGDPRPSVAVTIDAKTLEGQPILDLLDALSRRCELSNGDPVPRSSVERLLCTARISALLIRIADDGTIETLGVTDLLRDATRRQRRALKQRDGGCIFPGCHAPYDWCDAHHLIPWDDDGPTLIHNLALLCKHHHHLVHEGGWTLWRATEDDQIHLTKPDGTPVPLVQHGHQITTGHVPADSAPPPPPRPRRPGDPRFLTRREQHSREHRRQREQQRSRPGDERPPPTHD